jgi:uncharacterized RmlC-like cupin family protein
MSRQILTSRKKASGKTHTHRKIFVYNHVVYKLSEEMRIYLGTAFEFHLPSCLIYGFEKPKVVAWVAAPIRKL